ncbi:MAG: AMP-binding protein, partial [bacterium]|nr:AMP-binding protein [bacterium]
AQYDLSLTVRDEKENIKILLTYSQSLFKTATAEAILKQYRDLLEKITAELTRKTTQGPLKKAGELEIITGEEKQKIVYEFNDTEAEFPSEKNICQLFEEQVTKTPGNIAVITGTQEGNTPPHRELTYRQLNDKAGKLAQTLRTKGIKPNTIAALKVERSPEMLVAIFGIIKAGGAYLPIDPAYPPERVRYIMQDSKAGVLLTKGHQTLEGNEHPTQHHSNTTQPAVINLDNLF